MYTYLILSSFEKARQPSPVQSRCVNYLQAISKRFWAQGSFFRQTSIGWCTTFPCWPKGCSHWKHTPGFDHGLKLPKCASLWSPWGSRISNSLGRLTWRWESWNRLLNHSLKEFKKSSHLLNSFYDPMPNTCLYFFFNHFIVDKHFQCTAVQYTECWYTFKTEL